MERVWDYPRPPAAVPCKRRVRVELAGEVLADSTRALRVLETSHPPTIYIPLADVREELLAESDARSTWCEFKGAARYLDAVFTAGDSRRSPGPTRTPRPDTRRCAITSPSTPDAWTLPG